MLIVRVIVTGIQVATDALEVELFLVVIVIEVGSNTLVGNAFGIDVHVASLARLVVHNLLSVFQFSLAFPVDVFLVLGDVRPHILGTHGHLGLGVFQGSLRRKVTCSTIGFHTALAIVVYGLFPSHIGIGMEMT